MVQDKKWIATDPAPGDDTLRSRLLPLSVHTCQSLPPTNCAGLRISNRSHLGGGGDTAPYTILKAITIAGG